MTKGKKRTTSRKPVKTSLGKNSGVILVQKGHGNKHIPRGIRRRLVTTAGCNNYGWIQHYMDHKDLLTKLFGKKDGLIWMIKINFLKFMEKWNKIQENPNNPKIDI